MVENEFHHFKASTKIESGKYLPYCLRTYANGLLDIRQIRRITQKVGMLIIVAPFNSRVGFHELNNKNDAVTFLILFAFVVSHLCVCD